MIPKNIVLYFFDKTKIPTTLQSHYDIIKSRHPDFNVELYDNTTALEFIIANFDKRVEMAFRKLRPYTYKSELFRYCYIYKKGGIFVDLKYRLILDFNFSQLITREYLCQDINNNIIKSSLMVLKPYNLLLKQVITNISENAEINYYSPSPLQITGPLLLSNTFIKLNLNKSIYDVLKFTISGERKTIFLDGKMILKVYDNYEEDMKQTSDQPRLIDMHLDQDLYNWI